MMEIFIYFIVGLLGVEIAGKLIWFAKGEFPRREPSLAAWDIVISIVLIVWGLLAIGS